MGDQRKPDLLKRGWTTGACAAGAAKAAFEALVSGHFPNPVRVFLPGGNQPDFALCRTEKFGDSALCSIIKDAGDDPDVTHGAEITATVRLSSPGSGVVFKAGPGVGTVTKAGLPLPPGEPAINPKPREQITANIAEAAARLGVSADVEVTLSVPGGEEIAQKTWNPRLGIVGGISILGTTGVVIPYSCAAWIHSIHRGIDVARAAGITHVAGATGKTSERVVTEHYRLEEQQLIDMGDFAGGMLKYLRRHPIEKVTICGGLAKLVKMGQGALDLHSSRSQVDFAKLAQLGADVGADAALQARMAGALTAKEAFELAATEGVAIGSLVAKRARETARAVVDGACEIEVLVIDRAGTVVGRDG